MKHLLLTTIAAVLVVGCGPSVDIHQAATEGNIEAVKQHVAAGTDINAHGGKYDGTALHEAARSGCKEIAELLIDKGADENAKGDFSWTPLHYTAYEGKKEITELLIAKGADLNAKDEDGNTPLHWATMSVVGDKKREVAKLLITNGADVNVKRDDGKTPLDMAVGKTTALLRKHGGKTGEELKADGK